MRTKGSCHCAWRFPRGSSGYVPLLAYVEENLVGDLIHVLGALREFPFMLIMLPLSQERACPI